MILKFAEKIYNNVACFLKQVFGELSPIKRKDPTDTLNILRNDLEETIPNIYDKNKFAIEKYCKEDYKIIQVIANEEYLLKYRFLTIFDPSNRERYVDDILDISLNDSVVGLGITIVFPSNDEDKVTVGIYRSPEIYYTKSLRESVKKEILEYMDKLISKPISSRIAKTTEMGFIYACKTYNNPKDSQRQASKNKNPGPMELYLAPKVKMELYVAPKVKKGLYRPNSLFIESLVSVVGLTVVVISSVATYMLLNPLTL